MSVLGCMVSIVAPRGGSIGAMSFTGATPPSIIEKEADLIDLRLYYRHYLTTTCIKQVFVVRVITCYSNSYFYDEYKNVRVPILLYISDVDFISKILILYLCYSNIIKCFIILNTTTF